MTEDQSGMMGKYVVNASESEILPNRLGLTDVGAINEEELVGFVRTAGSAIDALSGGTRFSLRYLYDLHREALGNLYDFAGKLRTVDMSKDGFAFPSAKFLPDNMREFEKEFLEPLNEGIGKDDAALLRHIAALHAELLYIHPFREGNGRVIRLFTKLISLAKRGKDLDFEAINRGENFKRYVAAVQQAATKEYSLMQELFSELQT